MCNVAITRFLKTILVDMLVEIMLCGRYLVNFVVVDIYYNHTGRSAQYRFERSKPPFDDLKQTKAEPGRSGQKRQNWIQPKMHAAPWIFPMTVLICFICFCTVFISFICFIWFCLFLSVLSIYPFLESQDATEVK